MVSRRTRKEHSAFAKQVPLLLVILLGALFFFIGSAYIEAISLTGGVVSGDNATFVYTGPQSIVFSQSMTMDLSEYFSEEGLTFLATETDGANVTIEGNMLMVTSTDTLATYDITIYGSKGDEFLSVPLHLVSDITQPETQLAIPFSETSFLGFDELGAPLDEPVIDDSLQTITYTHQPLDLVGVGSRATLIGVTPFFSPTTARFGRMQSESLLTTDVFGINDIEVESAELLLAKYGPVDTIYRCPSFDADLFRCNNAWVPSALNYQENETHIWFVANSFSAYAGGSQPITASAQDFSLLTAPSVSNAVLSSSSGENLFNDNLTITYTATDTDGDKIKNMTIWYRNGEVWPTYAGYYENSTQAAFTAIDYANGLSAGPFNGASFANNSGIDKFGAYSFDGTNDYIAFTNPLRADKGTLLLWVYVDGLAGFNAGVFGHDNAGNNDGDFAIEIASGTLTFRQSTPNGAGETNITANSGVNYGEWTHVAVTFGPDGMFMYLNGTPQSNNDTNANGMNGTGQSTILGSLRANTHPFRGRIDEVFLFNTTLSEEQIRLIMNQQYQTLSSTMTSVGENWTVNVTTNDGGQDSLSVQSNQVTILAAGLNPTNLTIYKQYDGEFGGDALGFSQSQIADVDGDGVFDIVAGAHLSDFPNGTVSNGKAYIFSGANFSTILELNGSVQNDQFGFSVDGLNDLNSDGVPDIIVGAPRADPAGLSSAGTATVYSGADGSIIYQYNRTGSGTSDQLGEAVGNAGDLDNDSINEFIIAVPRQDKNGIDAGEVLVYNGSNGDLIWNITGNGSSRSGIAVAGGGDLNGDGYDDFIIGANQFNAAVTDAGNIRAYSGRTGQVLWEYNGTNQDQEFGSDVNIIPDITGDDREEVIAAGSFRRPIGFVFNGATGAILFNLTGEYVNAVGDQNGDGTVDVAGTWYNSTSGIGNLTVYDGTDGSVLKHVSSDLIGADLDGKVDWIPDINEDGLPEIIVGSQGNDPAPNGLNDDAGSVLVLSPLSGVPISTCMNLSMPDTTYFLTKDLVLQGEQCMNITANNVTMHCNFLNLSMNQSGAVGFNVTGVNDTTIKYCESDDVGTDSATFVYYQDAERSSLLNLKAIYDQGTSMNVFDAGASSFERITVDKASTTDGTTFYIKPSTTIKFAAVRSDTGSGKAIKTQSATTMDSVHVQAGAGGTAIESNVAFAVSSINLAFFIDSTTHKPFEDLGTGTLEVTEKALLDFVNSGDNSVKLETKHFFPLPASSEVTWAPVQAESSTNRLELNLATKYVEQAFNWATSGYFTDNRALIEWGNGQGCSFECSGSAFGGSSKSGTCDSGSTEIIFKEGAGTNQNNNPITEGDVTATCLDGCDFSYEISLGEIPDKRVTCAETGNSGITLRLTKATVDKLRANINSDLDIIIDIIEEGTGYRITADQTTIVFNTVFAGELATLDLESALEVSGQNATLVTCAINGSIALNGSNSSNPISELLFVTNITGTENLTLPDNWTFVANNGTNLANGTFNITNQTTYFLNASNQTVDMSNCFFYSPPNFTNGTLTATFNGSTISHNLTGGNRTVYNFTFGASAGGGGPPTISSVSLNSTFGTNGSTENLTATLAASDPDGDPIKNITNWFVNGSSLTVLNMPFEGGSSNSSTQDYSGFGNDGIVQGPIFNSTGGHDGFGAYEFDGTNDFINITEDTDLHVNNSLTVTAWINPDTVTGNHRIVGKGAWNVAFTPIREHFILVLVGNKLQYNLASVAGSSGYNSLTSITPGVWTHVAVTFDGNQMLTYINGLPDGANTTHGNVFMGSSNYWIGTSPNASTFEPFDGQIDEVMIFNETLTQGQIQALATKDPTIIDSSQTEVGDVWFVNVTPTDSSQSGSSVTSNSVTILNTAPNQPAVILNSSLGGNTTSENLTLYINATDADGDPIKNITTWFVNGSAYHSLNMPFESTGEQNTIAIDYSPNQTNGTVTGATFVRDSGADGFGWYDFDGINDVINVGPDNEWNFSESFTVSLWINSTDVTANGKAPMGRGGAAYDWTLWESGASGTDSISIYIRHLNNSVVSADCSFADGALYTSGEWMHFAGVFDRNAAGNRLKAYVNGTLCGSALLADEPIQETSNQQITIGRLGTGSHFRGGIDEVQVFKDPLSLEQIKELYKQRPVITSNQTQVGSVWHALVVPNDGTQDGLSVSSNNVTILNTQPNIPAVILNSTLGGNTTSENLTLYINATDADNDAIKNITNWYVDGESLAILNMPFEGGTTTTFAKDYSPHLNNGTGVGSPTPLPGRGHDGGGAMDFRNGVNTYMTMGSNPVNELNGTALTISVWANLTNTDALQTLVYKSANFERDGYGLLYRWDWLTNVNISGFVGDPANSGRLNFNVSPTLNQWHHIALTYNGTDLVGYFNGDEAGRNTVSLTLAENSSNPLLLGGRWTGAGYTHFFDGQLDDVLILNYTLSPEQIQALYEKRTDVIDSSMTVVGQTWYANVTPNDGTVDGTSVISNSVTILDTASACGSITEDTILNNDVTSTGTCFTLSVADTTLDCDGHRIRYGSAGGNNIYGIQVLGNNITVKDCNIQDVNTSGSSGAGIRISSGDNGRLINNTIVMNGTAVEFNNHGIQLHNNADGNLLLQNNITAAPATSGSHHGIFVAGVDRTVLIDNTVIYSAGNGIAMNSGASNNTLENNTVISTGLGVTNQAVLVTGGAWNNTIRRNYIYSNATGAGSPGIQLTQRVHNNLVENNVVITNGPSGARGIQVADRGARNIIRENLVITRGTGSDNDGIELQSNVNDTLVENNNITTNGSSVSDGIELTTNVLNNTFRGNRISTASTNSFAIRISDSNHSLFVNNVFTDVVDWITTDESTNNFTNTTFETQNGSIKIIGKIVLNSTNDIRHSSLNISQNRAFVNTSNHTSLNTTGQIILHNITFTSPLLQVDYEDDGTFVTCNSPTCEQISYTTNNLVFNVTHFTTFGSGETPGNITIAQVILNSTDGSGALFGNASSSDNLTLFAINASVSGIKNITTWYLNGSAIQFMHLPFEGGSSSGTATTNGTTKDYSQVPLNVTVINATWNSTGGHDGKGAYDFTLNSSTIFVGAEPRFARSDYSFSLWFKSTDSNRPNQRVLQRQVAGIGSQNHFALDINTNRVLYFYSNGSAGTQFAQSFFNATTGDWIHIVGTYDNATKNISLYINGTLASSNIATVGPFTEDGVAPQTVLIGNADGSAGSGILFNNPTNGTIDDVMFFDRTLSANQAYSLYRDELIITSDETLAHETWYANVTPNNGIQDGASLLSNNVVIVGSAPNASAVILNSTDGSGALFNRSGSHENLTYFVINASDPDTDPIKNITANIVVNGSGRIAINLPFEGGSTSGSETQNGSTREYADGRNATVINATFNRTGGYDGFGAYEFDGVDDYIELSNQSGFTNSGTMLLMWIKTNSTNGWIFDQVEDPTTKLALANDDWADLYVNHTGNVVFRFNGGGHLLTVGSTTLVNDSSWHHIAAYQKNRSYIEIYIDGNLEATHLDPAATGGIDNPNAINLGRQANGSEYFNGSIDDFWMVKYHLTPEQISAYATNITNTIVSQQTNHNETWQINIVPNDRYGDGPLLTSNQILILNENISIRFVNPTPFSGTLVFNGSLTTNTTATYISNLNTTLYNSTKGVVNTSSIGSSPLTVAHTNLSSGVYYFNSTGSFDTNSNSTETRNIVMVNPTDVFELVINSTEINDTTTNGPSLDDGDQWGSSVDNMGDLDGDGIVDIIAGSQGDDAGGSGRGAVIIIFLNADGSVKSQIEINDTTINGPVLADGDTYGFGLANIGDLDGDGVQDIVVGAFGDDSGGSSRGAVHLSFLNSDGSVKSTIKIDESVANGPALVNGDTYGYAVASLGDLDGDGVQDIAVGAPFDDAGGADRGTVHIHFLYPNGSVKTSTEINDVTANGPSLTNSDVYGVGVQNIGDLDGDGVQDIAVGAVGDDAGGSSRGAIHISFLNTDGSVKSTVEINDLTSNGPDLRDGDQFGNTIANMGDLNGDGIQDLAIGAFLRDDGGTNAGALYLTFMNRDGSVNASHIINKSTPNAPSIDATDAFAFRIANLGDFDLNGVPDLIVGAANDNGTGNDRGAVNLILLGPAQLAPNVTSLTPVNSSTFEVFTTIQIGANVTDVDGVSVVLANLTLPNGTSTLLTLTNASSFYNTSYTLPNLSGSYNYTIIANNTEGRINSTESGFFLATLVPINPSITVSKTESEDPLVNVTQINYTITISNVGPGNATNVTVVETYPVNTSFITSTTAPITADNRTFFLGNLSPGSSITLNITLNLTNVNVTQTLVNNLNVSFLNFSNQSNVVATAATTSFTLPTAGAVTNPVSTNRGGGGGSGGGISWATESTFTEPEAPLVPPSLEVEPTFTEQDETSEDPEEEETQDTDGFVENLVKPTIELPSLTEVVEVTQETDTSLMETISWAGAMIWYVLIFLLFALLIVGSGAAARQSMQDHFDHKPARKPVAKKLKTSKLDVKTKDHFEVSRLFAAAFGPKTRQEKEAHKKRDVKKRRRGPSVFAKAKKKIVSVAAVVPASITKTKTFTRTYVLPTRKHKKMPNRPKRHERNSVQERISMALTIAKAKAALRRPKRQSSYSIDLDLSLDTDFKLKDIKDKKGRSRKRRK